MNFLTIFFTTLVCIFAIHCANAAPHKFNKDKVYKSVLRAMVKDALKKKYLQLADFDSDEDEDEVTLQDYDDDDDITAVDDTGNDDITQAKSDSLVQVDDPVKRDETPRLFEPKNLELEKQIKKAFGDKDEKSLFDEHDNAYGFPEVKDHIKESRDELNAMRKELFAYNDEDANDDLDDEKDENMLMSNVNYDNDEENEKMANSQLTNEDKQAMGDTIASSDSDDKSTQSKYSSLEDLSDIMSEKEDLKDKEVVESDSTNENNNNDENTDEITELYNNNGDEDTFDSSDDDKEDEDFYPFESEEDYRSYLKEYLNKLK